MIPPGLALAAPCQRAGPGSGAEAAPSLPSEALSLSSSWSLVVLKALPRDSALKDGPFPAPDTARLVSLGPDCRWRMVPPQSALPHAWMKGCAAGLRPFLLLSNTNEASGPGLPGKASTPPGHCPASGPPGDRGWRPCAPSSLYICIKEWDFIGAHPTLSLCDSLSVSSCSTLWPLFISLFLGPTLGPRPPFSPCL